MFNFKYFTVSMIVLGSSSLFAGGMSCGPENVTVPCETTAFDAGIQGIYVQPIYNGSFGYFGNDLTNGTLVGQAVNLDWNFGFRIEGSYHFNTGNDINVNWTSYNQTTNLQNISTIILTAFNVDWKPSWNAVNIEFGQHVDYGESKNIRFHGGGQYASIKTNITYTNITLRPEIILKFNGFGPRAGLDMSYDLDYGFAIYCNSAAAILVGNSEYSADVTAINDTTLVLSQGSKTVLVPELEAKLGLKYNYELYQGAFVFDAGWMWANYFNAQHFGVGNTETDFGLQGPYLALKFIGDA